MWNANHAAAPLPLLLLPLAPTNRYIFPPTEATAKVRAGTEHCLYFCGNSLGLQPKNVRKYIGEELDKWSEYGVEAHFKPIRPWVSFDEVGLQREGKGREGSRSTFMVGDTHSTVLHSMQHAGGGVQHSSRRGRNA